jgi:hypothetical protein
LNYQPEFPPMYTEMARKLKLFENEITDD